jgi:hypothetical protein
MITSRSLSLSALAFAALLPTAVPAVAHADDAHLALRDGCAHWGPFREAAETRRETRPRA